MSLALVWDRMTFASEFFGFARSALPFWDRVTVASESKGFAR